LRGRKGLQIQAWSLSYPNKFRPTPCVSLDDTFICCGLIFDTMVDGPLGRELRLIDDNKKILVLIGIDGPEPPRDIQISLRETVNTTINQALIDRGADIKPTRETVNLNIEKNPSSRQRDELGGATLHVQQFEIKTELEEVSQGLVNAVHNTVVDEVDNLGFNVVGTKTTVV